MKKIVIYQEGSNIIELLDNDGTEVSAYAEKIANLLSAGNVSILNATSGSLVIRPSKIVSLFISDDKNLSKIPIKKESKEPVKKEKEMDIITDVDD